MTESQPDSLYSQAPLPAIETMSSRREFLRVAATGRRWITPHFIVQAMPAAEESAPPPAATPPRHSPLNTHNTQNAHSLQDALGPMRVDPVHVDPVRVNPVRVGYTASKKVGNSVVRNRAKRRLREIVRLGLAPLALPGWHYVFVARTSDHEKAFADLQSDMVWALRKLHSGADLEKAPPRPASPKRGGQNMGHKPSRARANQSQETKTPTSQRKNDEAGA